MTIWTFFIVLSRLGARDQMGPYDLALLRFAFAALAVAPVVLARRSGARFGTLTARRAAVLAAFGGLGFTGFAFAGFARAPAAHAAVLMPGTLPFSTALIAYLVLGERVSARRAAGLAAILAGVALMAWQALAHDGAQTWRGDLMFPLAAMCWAVFTVLARKWGVDPVDATLAVPVFALALYLPLYCLLAEPGLAQVPWRTIVATGVFQGVIALVVSMWAFSRAVAVLGPVKTTMVTALAPAAAAILAVPLLGESLTLPVVLGLAAVSAGMVIGVGSGAGRDGGDSR
ncbi:MAG: DMT family transporter [Burkholderiales bacterium]|nr:DMT family transporter [Burkholderiales bacterium]